MNRNNNIFNKNEVENKLKDFKEGKDYSVSPTDDGKEIYNFFSDELKRFWDDDRVLVNRVVETDSNKDYDYYGQFENYQDGGYRSFQSWTGKNYQDSESYKRNAWWENGNTPFRDPQVIGESLEVGKIAGKHKLKQIEPNYDLEWKYGQLKDKLNSLLSRPESDFGINGKEKKEFEIAQVKKDIADIEREIEKRKNNVDNSRPQHLETCQCGKSFDKAKESWCVDSIKGGVNHWCSHDCAEKYKDNPHGKVRHSRPVWLEKGDNNHSDLQKENQELHQELAEVKKQLFQVLEELRKLKNNVNGKDSEKLNQQIAHNEKLIKNGENISLSEVQEQVNKSQALMKEFNIGVSSTKNDKGNGSLPYVIGGSVILASAGIIGYFLLKKNKRK